MQSLKYVKGSDGAANASLMTVTTIRAALASTILVNTVANAPTFFYGSMGTPHTFTDPVTSETITVISEASAVDFAGQIVSGHVEIISIAPGYTDLGSKVGDIIIIRPITEWANNIFNVLNQSLNDDGTFKNDSIATAAMFADAVDPVLREGEILGNLIVSGGVWSTLTGLNAAMTALVGHIDGTRGTVALVATRAYTASKDTYVDVLRTGTAFSLVYTEVTNGAASPALAASSIRLAKVVTNGSAITSITQTGVDSLNNAIRPTGAVKSSNVDFTTFSSGTDANGWAVTKNSWGKKVYSKKVSQAITLGTGIAFANYSIASTPIDVGSNIANYYCNFTAQLPTGFRQVSYNVGVTGTAIELGVANLFTGGTVSTTANVTMIIVEV